MALRWYTTVVDSRDPQALARWWARALGWTLVHDTPEEVLLVPGWVTPEVLRDVPWERRGPGLSFVRVPEAKAVKNRLHLDLAPHPRQDRDAEIRRLLDLGATPADVGQDEERSTGTVLADPEGNEFCVLSSRDS